MKKILFLFVFFSIGFLYANEIKKPIKEITQEVKFSWEIYKQTRDEARGLEAKGEYILASKKYIELAKISAGLDRKDIQAWCLNNAGYMIIKLHKQDKKTNLKSSLSLLEQAKNIKEAETDCVIKIENNIKYIIDEGGKNENR